MSKNTNLSLEKNEHDHKHNSHNGFTKKIKFTFKGFSKSAKNLYNEFKNFMSGKNLEEAGYHVKNTNDLRKQIRSPLRFTAIIIGFAFFFFIIWGGFAPLDTAAIAPGSIVLSENVKTIQHLEGGVIDKILVKEGDTVTASQPLIILNDISAKSRMQIALSQLRADKAIEKRLLTEKYEEDLIVFDDDILDENIEEVKKILKIQKSIFHSRLKALNGKLDIYNQKIVQTNEQIKGYKAVLASVEIQNKSFQEQLKNVNTLYAKGYSKKTDLLELSRRAEEITGRMSEIRSHISQSQELIAQSQLEIISTKNEYHNEINEELKRTQTEILKLTEEYQAAKDVLFRTVIKAPTSGIITSMQYHTVGGVISPHSKILDIIPQDDKLIVEVRVATKDIESIYPGLKAKVQLSAYKSRLVPRLDGEVIYVAADRVNDERMGPYYVARVEIYEAELKKVNYDIKLHPGMPAEVFIVKGERTFLQYMLSPILDSFHKAFKEK